MEHSVVDRDSNLEKVPFKQETDESTKHCRAIYIIECRQGDLVLDVGFYVVKVLDNNTIVYRAQEAIDMCSKNASSWFLGFTVPFFIMRVCVGSGARIESA